MIGGTPAGSGPLMGALLLGTLQQVTTVTISSAVNLLVVGVLLVGFVIIAPNGPHRAVAALVFEAIVHGDTASRSGKALQAVSALFVALDEIDLSVAAGERVG